MTDPTDLRALALSRVDEALARLRGERPASPEVTVHEVRKRIKELRAALRVARPALERPGFRRQDRRLRDAGRALSGLRDAHVLRQTLRGLALEDEALAAGLALLGPEEDTAPGEDARDRVLRALEQAREDVLGWSLRGAGFERLGPGLRRLYAEGRDAMWFARQHADAEATHAWRKHVKHLRASLRPLGPVWPVMAAAHDAEWDRLGELLGQEHDLHVLVERLSSGPAVPAVELAERRAAALRAEALALGERLYAETPRAFTRRWRAWWRCAAREGLVLDAAG